MARRTATRAPGRLRWIGAIAAVAGVLAMAYAAWAAYLAVMAHEGVLPPRSRLPEVPAGVRVLSATKECGKSVV